MSTETFTLRYPSETLVTVHSFTRQMERDGVVIGRPDLGTFLSLPVEALEVLDDLARGLTVGQTQSAYFERHGETPDLEEFLGLLEDKGIVRQGVGEGGGEPEARRASASPPRAVRYHFTAVPQSLARKLFGRSAFAVYGALAACALLAVWLEPSIVPGRSAFYFADHRTLKAVAFALFVYGTLFVHEMYHLLAARAVGVSSRMGISHRLWYLVAETDLTGLWGVAKRQRYLPLLAGSLSDVVSASCLLILLFLQQRSILSLPPILRDLVRAGCFMYFMRLLWQTFLFVRTDFYYVIASLLECKNLLKDTEDFLRIVAARLLGRKPSLDQSAIPAAEQRIIRGYAVVWLAGRGLAFSTLFLVTLPVLWKYLVGLSGTLHAGYSAQPGAFIDALVMGVIFLVPIGAGFTLWIRSLTQQWRKIV
jgi:hypothetical protein